MFCSFQDIGQVQILLNVSYHLQMALANYLYKD